MRNQMVVTRLNLLSRSYLEFVDLHPLRLEYQRNLMCEKVMLMMYQLKRK